jgi:histone deacetylase complex regulatory component SIN3
MSKSVSASAVPQSVAASVDENEMPPYLDLVEQRLCNQPHLNYQFVNILDEFYYDTIPAMIRRVFTLFEGHPDLMEGFKAFLPSCHETYMQWATSNHELDPSEPAVAELEDEVKDEQTVATDSSDTLPASTASNAQATSTTGAISTSAVPQSVSASAMPQSVSASVVILGSNDSPQLSGQHATNSTSPTPQPDNPPCTRTIADMQKVQNRLKDNT